MCSGLYPVRSQSLHGGYSSGCIVSAMQPFTEKSSRTTLHYVIRNDSARDLVLPPLAKGSEQSREAVISSREARKKKFRGRFSVTWMSSRSSLAKPARALTRSGWLRQTTLVALSPLCTALPLLLVCFTSSLSLEELSLGLGLDARKNLRIVGVSAASCFLFAI